MKKLIIAEKPSVGKDIARALGLKNNGNGYISGGEYTVTWAMGHLITLKDPEAYGEKYKKWELNTLPIIPDHMGLSVIPQTRKQFNIIKELLSKASQVIIATDAGREGELVARWILDYAGNKLPIKRLWISSVTDKAIKSGFSNLKDGKEYLNLYHSAYARAVADWIVGINATRALTTKHNASLSCGRVQTPTLAIISKREGEIRNFVPKEFYEIKFAHKNIRFNHTNDRIFDKDKANSILNSLKKESLIIKDIKFTTKKSHIQGYDLTSLQQDANRLFDMSAKDTLAATQSLYERHKAVTYPRTDSKHITTDMIDTLAERVRAVNFGNYRDVSRKLLTKKIDAKGFANNSLVTDHHAIIPTEEAIDIGDLNNNERKIYDLIVKRFLAILLPEFQYEETKIIASVLDQNFSAKGQRTINLGYKEVYTKKSDIENDNEEDSQELPAFKIGQTIEGNFSIHTGKTNPPSYFTEGTLLKDMERFGLGTVATRADIIEKLFNSALIEKNGKHIQSTGKGRQLLDLAPTDLCSPELTSRWESELLQIATGKQNKDNFLSDIKTYTHDIIKEIKQSESTFKHTNMTNHKCPSCGKNMLEIKGKKGTYLVCHDRECGERKNIEITTNARCPKCKKKLSLVGEKDKKQSFVCKCGHRENKEAFEERKKREGNKLNKKDVQKFIQKANKEDDFKNNPLADQLKGLKF